MSVLCFLLIFELNSSTSTFYVCQELNQNRQLITYNFISPKLFWFCIMVLWTMVDWIMVHGIIEPIRTFPAELCSRCCCHYYPPVCPPCQRHFSTDCPATSIQKTKRTRTSIQSSCECESFRANIFSLSWATTNAFQAYPPPINQISYRPTAYR